VRVARDLASRFHASMIGVSALLLPPPIVSEGIILEAVTEDDVARMKASLTAKEEWFRTVVGLSREKVEWRWALANPTAFLAEQARSADLVVMKSAYANAGPSHFVDPAEAVVRMGRPVILVPDHVKQLKANRIVVGWKDTREARVAVLQALPLLTKATEVTIIELCLASEQDKARRHVDDVARYLSLRGATCRTDIRVYTAEPDSAHLMRLASAAGADLIVSGAYGHSRLGEWLFGGMTQGLLKDATCCLMMSH
jgi:nucleotide-binding universal stress UspA family protein